MTRIRNLVLRVVMAAAAFLLAAYSYAGEAIDLQLRWHHQFQFAGYYAAVEKGFYQDEGLQVTLHAGGTEHQPASEVLAGRAQYGVGNSEVLFERLKGKPIVALAAIFQHSASVLLTRKDSNITSVHGLVGKKAMLMNLTEDADLLAMFLKEGISLSQVHIVPSSYKLNDLISGKVDAFNSYRTNEPYFLKQRNVPFNTIDPSDYGVDFYSDILFTSEAELNSNPERVEAVRRATLKGWHYAMAHPDEIIDLLISKYKVEKTREHLAFEAAEMQKLILPDLVEIGHMNPGRWQHMADVFVKAGLVKPNYSLDGFIYDGGGKHLPEWLLPVLIAALVVLAAVSLATYYLLRLNRRIASTQGTLRESEGRLRLALSAARQGWFELDLQTGEVLTSDEYPRILGYTPEEFRTSLAEWKNSVHPDDSDALNAAFRKCLADGGPETMEYRRKTRDGGWVWLKSVGKISVWGAQHQPLKMIGMHTDISDRKKDELELGQYRIHLEKLVEKRTHELARATEQLRVSEERFGYALQATNDGVWDWNVQTNRSYINSAYCEMLGYAPGELRSDMETHLLDLIHSDDRERFLALLQQRLERIGSYEIEFRLRCKDGRYKWILSRGKVVERDGAGHVLRAVGTHVDLTARKATEMQLREAKEVAESASRAKSVFLANMSHELRTPLNGIMGMTSLALRQASDAGLIKKLNKIDLASKHLLAVINDILDISKIEAERLSLERIPFRLSDPLASLMTLVGHRISEQGLTFVTDVPLDIVDTLRLGDPLRLGQILLNLMSNAIKFTTQGSIVLRVREMASSPTEVLLRFEVKDTGIGVSAEDQKRLFTAFEQADSSMTRKYGGTGLGLAISKRLVYLMGGEIGMESEAGQGSTFWFTVRLSRATESDEPVPACTGASPENRLKAEYAGVRILLVEDEPVSQEVARELLEDAGLTVAVADDGALALEMTRSGQYDLILMDMQMPNLNGVDATRLIRTVHGYEHIPIVAMTANAFNEDRHVCLAAGMNDHVAKPVDPASLYEILLKWLAKSPVPQVSTRP